MSKPSWYKKVKETFDCWLIIKELCAILSAIKVPLVFEFLTAVINYFKPISPTLLYSITGIVVLACLCQIIKARPYCKSLLLFTTSDPLASLEEIAEELERVYGFPKNKIFALLLGGYWRGCFDNKEVEGPNRLQILKVLHDVHPAQNDFIFAYENQKQPATHKDLPDGGCSVDTRPYLKVPHANTENWTTENCQKAFEELASESKRNYPNNIWPSYMPEHVKVLYLVRIPKSLLKFFLKKEKISTSLL